MLEVKVKNGSPYIDGQRCSYETKKIRSEILSFSEVNEQFILPKKYSVVFTKLNGFAKIVKAKKEGQKLIIDSVSDWLTLKECAKLYGEKVNCKWLSPDGNDWIDKKMDINHSFLRQMEQGSIKEAYR